MIIGNYFPVKLIVVALHQSFQEIAKTTFVKVTNKVREAQSLQTDGCVKWSDKMDGRTKTSDFKGII